MNPARQKSRAGEWTPLDGRLVWPTLFKAGLEWNGSKNPNGGILCRDAACQTFVNTLTVVRYQTESGEPCRRPTVIQPYVPKVVHILDIGVLSPNSVSHI